MNSNKFSITPRSSTAITGLAVNSTTVYHGPSSSIYATVGTIGPNETVNILATSMGWYHIEYTITGTSQRKSGYVPQSVLSNIAGGTPTEEDFYGGYCYASTELDVRTCDVFSNTATVGTLFAKEGCTFLFSYSVNGSNIAFIEYSTSSGTKRGYVYADYLIFPCETIVCIANETIPVYGSPDFETSAQLGTIYTNELMGVVAKNNNVIYVEYNTSKGRKRGYIDWTKVNPRDYTSGTVFNNFYTLPANSGCHINDETVDVYGGPSTSYAKIGTVRHENINCFWNNNSSFQLTCIEYIVSNTGKVKRGYIDPTKVISGSLSLENNPIEDLTVSYSQFTREVYGQTQLNRDLVYYKTGNGPNRLFLTFALHGWEDGKKTDGTYYHGDGNMLIKIAKRFMNNFCNLTSTKLQSLQNKWTIFVFPGINLDGIINGNSNNGFGRCLYSSLDPNRNWPGNFEINTTSPRYKTGTSYLGNNSDHSDAKELLALKNVITANAGTSQNVLVDVHGWLNQTIGNTSISQYYWDSFGIPSYNHSNNYGNGYLIAWAKNPTNELETIKNQPGIGASSCLLELPPTTDYSDTNMNNYGDKFFNGTLSLLEETGDSVGYPDNYDNISFERLYNQLNLLYTAANSFNPSASIKEKNILVLEYLRSEEYSAIKYQFLYGLIDIDFVNNVIVNNRIYDNTHYLHPNNIIVPDSKISGGIRISHLAACLNGYLHNNPSFPTQTMEEQSNALGCWAGDLVQMGDIFKNVVISSDTAEQIIATNDISVLQPFGINELTKCGFAYEDWTHDIDAVCLKDSLETMSIDEAFRAYYSNATLYNNRHHTFIEKTLPNSTNLYSDLYSLAMSYLDPNTLATIGFNTLFLYNGENNVALAQGFANKFLYFYNLEEPPAPTIPQFDYGAYCQNLGWQEGKNNWQMAGLYGQGLRVEAVIMNAPFNIQYRVHMAGIGWGAWVPNGCVAGTMGESRAIEAIEIISSTNTMVGQAYVENIGFQSEVTGSHIMIGTTGQGLRLEGFRLKFI